MPVRPAAGPLLVIALAASLPAAAQDRLAEAKRQCWEAVGIYGDPYKSRGAFRFEEEVRACVRQKMGVGGGGQPRR